ncbi:tetratricopeptide repeat protein [Zavarzinella formosa]|uniref:tetratricopeptide repeat protein n=1 Tax=Zavarzinella formosa TaxID=360055 RepID=UPI000308B7D0|nr:tetratricopeptide repeat protein [Zavarzinella formosa]
MVRVNFRMLFRLIVLVAATGGGIYALYAYQSQRIPEAMLWQANNAAELGKTDDAMKYMRRYLELRPDDYEQTTKLADLMQARATGVKDLTNALYLYEKVMREAPQRHDAGKKFVTVCIRLGRHADGLRVAEELAKALPKDGELLGHMAECLVAQNKLPEARQKFEEALKHSPDNVRASEQYARLLTFKLNQPKEGLAVLDQLVKSSGSSAEACLLRARALHTDRDDEAAVKDLDRVFWIDPENIEALLLSAEIEQFRGNNRRARETLLAMLDTAPRDVRGYRALSWLNLLSGNSTEAMQTLERGLVRLPDAPDLLTPLGDLSLDQGDTDKTADIIKRLEAKPTAAAQGKYLRARLLMKQGRHKDAITILEPLRAEMLALAGVEQQVSLMLASCQERCGDFAAVRETLKRMLAKDPGNLPARVAMGNMLLNAGQLAEASREYDAAARSPIAGLGVRTMAGKIRLARLEADGKAKPEEWKELEANARELIRLQPNSIDPVVLLAEVQSGHGEIDAGLETLRAACRQRPADSRLWIALANLAWKHQGAMMAEQILNEARLVTGDTVEWKLARARLITSELTAVDLKKLTGSTAQLSETERLRLWQGIVEILDLAKNRLFFVFGINGPLLPPPPEPSMLAACQELASLSSQDIISRRHLFLTAIRTKDSAAEQRWGNQLKEASPSGELFVSLVRALEESTAKEIALDRLKELASLAERATRNNPEMVEGHWLAARVAEKGGDSTKAGKAYAVAVQMDPLNTKLISNRIRFLETTGQTALLEQVKSHVTHDPRMSLTRRMAVDGMSERDAASKSNTDYWSHQLTGDLIRKIETLQEKLDEAENSLGRNTLLNLLAAKQAWLKIGCPEWKPELRSAEEMRIFAAACMAHAEFTGEPQSALPVLKALIANKNTKPEDVAWAKQAETAIRFQLGDKDGDKFDPAELKKWLEQEPRDITGHRGRVTALTGIVRSVSGSAKEPVVAALLRSLTEVTKDPSATVGDWYQLAQVYRSIGDRANSRRCLNELLKREPNNLQYLAINVEELLSEGRLADAEPMIASLQPGVHDLRVASVLAKYLALVNDARGVLETTDMFVKTVDAGSADGVIRQRQAAELLDQLARLSLARNLSGGQVLLEGACERYRAVSLQYPEAIGGWVALLSLGGSPEKAFDELERRMQRLSPTDLAVAGMRILRNGSPTDKQFQVVNGWLTKALADQPNSPLLLLQQAEWNTMQTQFDAAAKIYRRVLELEANQPVALNNLAWVLAADPITATEALALADKAIRQSGVNPELLDTRARILISVGQFPEAKQSLQEALNVSQTGLRYFHLALWHLKQDQRDEAKRIFREAVNRGLDQKNVHPADRGVYRELLATVN